MNVLGTAAFFAFGALLVLFGANAGEIIQTLRLDYAEFGLAASTLLLGIGAGIFCAGPLVDRLARRPLFLLACASVALAALSVGPRTTYEALLFASFVIGFGAGFYETLLNAVIVEESASKAPRRLLFIHSAATCGAAVTLFAIGSLREPLGLAWYDSFRAAGLLHGALLFGAPLLPTQRPSVHDWGDQASSRSEEGRRLLIAICIATSVYVGVESTLTTFVADHAQKNLGFGADRAAGVVGFFWSGLLAGRLTLGLSHKEPGAGTTALLALVSSAVVAAFFGGWTTSPELAMALTGFFLGGVFPIMIGLAGVTMPGAAGTAVALAAGLGSLGGFLVPWLTGILAAHTDLAVALTSLSPWLLVLAIASAVIRRLQIR